jgi:cell division septation protein DedD
MELFSFEGRIRRRDYWLITLGVGVASNLAETGAEVAPVLCLLVLIPLCWISLAAGAKRCHDLGHSGWWQLIPFFPLLLAFQDGDPGTNEYGPNPKAPQPAQPGTSGSTPVVQQPQAQQPQQTQPTTQNSASPSPWGNVPTKTTSITPNAQKTASDNLSDSISSKWK